MSKSILLSYDVKSMHFFGDGEWSQPVELTLQKKIWFGFKTKTYTITYTINMFQSLGDHFKNWDEMIETKREVKV